ncbi:MAG: hypothetical protein U0136_10405 [Bdellovibrionota bacterium]
MELDQIWDRVVTLSLRLRSRYEGVQATVKDALPPWFSQLYRQCIEYVDVVSRGTIHLRPFIHSVLEGATELLSRLADADTLFANGGCAVTKSVHEKAVASLNEELTKLWVLVIPQPA